ncbi:hypothetical protein KI688_007285 [Linnemannia hyalina]|uniref:Uncharacterized protein n=1 Tax=Linnemannia hyalina TaxID=64524 RepID=A0A9P7XI45_9FUNG|nr:hypothetical protein KI688_007285 [Linnemannia hyalina]
MEQTYVFTTKTSKFVKRDLLSIKKDDMLCLTGDVICHCYNIGGNLVYAPSITPEAIKKHKGHGPIVDFADVVKKKTWGKQAQEESALEKEIAAKMQVAVNKNQAMTKRAASSELAHEALKKIASQGKTAIAQDVEDVVEVPMDPVKDTLEDELNLQKGIRQSIMAMNLIGGTPNAGESSSTIDVSTKSRRSSMATLLTRSMKSPSLSSGSDQEPASRRPSMASLFGGDGGQSAQQPSPAQATEEQEQEQDETLRRRRPVQRSHLRFQPPLTTANPPGKKKAVPEQSQQGTHQSENLVPTIDPTGAPSSVKKGKSKRA